MSDEPALLAAILAHPDEDTPRLIYADWLQENGQGERAEFIRLQCASDLSESQLVREGELEERNRGRWLVELGVPQFAEAQWVFRRGFPETLLIEAFLFEERFEAFKRVPWLRFLSLREVWGYCVRNLCSREWPPQWIELELSEEYHNENDSELSLEALAKCPQALQLRRLRLTTFAIHPESLAVLQSRFGHRLVIG